MEESHWYRDSSGSDRRHCKRCLNCSSAEGRRNGTVPAAETTGASTSKAPQQAGAITALRSYDECRSWMLKDCDWSRYWLDVGIWLWNQKRWLHRSKWNDSIIWKGLWVSWKETTVTRFTRESNRSLSTPSLTVLKVESFDQSNSTSREHFFCVRRHFFHKNWISYTVQTTWAVTLIATAGTQMLKQ